MKSDVAIVDKTNPNKIILSGTHMECAKFLKTNNWLYNNNLILRCVNANGTLGGKLRPFLWEME
jgi:hypothetical protein